MAAVLASLKSNFILSINDHPEMRDTFSAFEIKPVSLKYSVKKDTSTEGKELLIRNF
jgi:DNA adenine methylase